MYVMTEGVTEEVKNTYHCMGELELMHTLGWPRHFEVIHSLKLNSYLEFLIILNYIESII